MKKYWYILFVYCLVMMLSGCGGQNSHEGEVQIPRASSDLEGENYEDIKRVFENKGFKNVNTEKIEDLITGWLTKDGEVEEVLINGTADYEAKKWVPDDTEVIIRYHTFSEKSSEEENIPSESESTVSPESTDGQEMTKKTETVEETGAEKGEEQEETEETEPQVLTVDNCEDLGELLKSGDYDDYTAFAEKYEGQIIQFAGSIDYLTNHGDYKTRYDILTSGGDYSEETQEGPTFKFEDVGVADLGLDDGESAESLVRVGSNVLITAKVENFNYDTGIFFLDPVSIQDQ